MIVIHISVWSVTNAEIRDVRGLCPISSVTEKLNFSISVMRNEEEMTMVHQFFPSATHVREKWMPYSESAPKTALANIESMEKTNVTGIRPVGDHRETFCEKQLRSTGRILTKNVFPLIRCSLMQFSVQIPNMASIFLGHEWLMEKIGVPWSFLLRFSSLRWKNSVSQPQMKMDRNLAHLCTPHWLPVKMMYE